MGKLFQGFKILCTNFDHIVEKKGETIQGGDILQGRILINEICSPNGLTSEFVNGVII